MPSAERMIEGVVVLSQTPTWMEFTYYTMFHEGIAGGGGDIPRWGIFFFDVLTCPVWHALGILFTIYLTKE